MGGGVGVSFITIVSVVTSVRVFVTPCIYPIMLAVLVFLSRVMGLQFAMSDLMILLPSVAQAHGGTQFKAVASHVSVLSRCLKKQMHQTQPSPQQIKKKETNIQNSSLSSNTRRKNEHMNGNNKYKITTNNKHSCCFCCAPNGSLGPCCSQSRFFES